MLADYHMHTAFSGDSEYPMEDLVIKAIEKGVDEICFSEHVDYGLEPQQIVNYQTYRKEFERCKKVYGNKITLKWGAEFGMQTHTVQYYEEDMKKYPLDFVILSCHQIDNSEFWNQQYQEGKNQKEINDGYYRELFKVMQVYKQYSVLGHLDAIRRDDPYGDYPFAEVKDIVTKILTLAIQEGKGIEVNTSYDRYGLKDITPCRDILRLYHELGGTIITIGSDTHKEEHVAYKLKDMQEELKKMGFTTFTTFDKMKPIFHSL